MVLNSNIIGNRIKKFREASNITQEQLGEQIICPEIKCQTLREVQINCHIKHLPSCAMR